MLLTTAQGEGRSSSGCDNEIIVVLSNLINTHFDAMEKLINKNLLNELLDFAFEEIKSVKKKINVIDKKTNKYEATFLWLQERLAESERYSGRWHFKTIQSTGNSAQKTCEIRNHQNLPNYFPKRKIETA